MENLGVNIAITQFKCHIANAILNNQEKLNKDKNAYISSDELPAILNNFGTTDISKLLKSDGEKFKGSIFSQDQNGKKLINIMALKDENVSTILNNQDKLNADSDAYLNEEEVKEVLKYFGVSDISALLRDDCNVSEQKDNEIDDNDPKLTSGSAKDDVADDGSTAKAEQKDGDPTDEKPQTDEKTSDDGKKDILSTPGTAANELNNEILANRSFNVVGTPYKKPVEDLQKFKNQLEEGGEDTHYVDFMLQQFDDLAQMESKSDVENKTTVVKEKTISYGKDGANKAKLVQSFSLDTNSAINGKKEEETDKNEGSKAEETEENSDNSQSDDKKRKTDVCLSYNIDFRTLNPVDKGNIHAIGSVSAGSDNYDVQGVVSYSKGFSNGGMFGVSANVNETIKSNNNKGNLGFSADYLKGNFSTGVMGYYSHSMTDGEKDNSVIVEAHGRYGDIVRGTIGMESSDGLKYYYAKAAASGKKISPNSNLSLYGNVEGEYGLLKMPGLDKTCQNMIIKADGGLAFTSNDVNVNLYGNVSYRRLNYSYDGQNHVTSGFTGSVKGAISTKNIDFSTNFTVLNGPGPRDQEGENGQIVLAKNNTSFSAGAQLAFPKVFGDKVTPFVDYNLFKKQGPVEHNIGVGVIITP